MITCRTGVEVKLGVAVAL